MRKGYLDVTETIVTTNSNHVSSRRTRTSDYVGVDPYENVSIHVDDNENNYFSKDVLESGVSRRNALQSSSTRVSIVENIHENVHMIGV